MIHSSDLTDETKKFADLLEQAGDYARKEIEEDLKKISENIYERMYETFDIWFSQNIKDNFMQSVAHEVRSIMVNFLSGNLDTIKNCNLLSDFTFDNLHNIRLAIWKAAGTDIETSIISEQDKQIDRLKREIDMLRNRY